MSKKLMQQPHIVVSRWDFKTWPETETWLKENANDNYQFVGLARNSVLLNGEPGKSTMHSLNADEHDYNVIAMFADAEDAMKYKLRWVGTDG